MLLVALFRTTKANGNIHSQEHYMLLPYNAQTRVLARII